MRRRFLGGGGVTVGGSERKGGLKLQRGMPTFTYREGRGRGRGWGQGKRKEKH